MSLTYSVLIVDDVTDNIKVAMSILKEDNYNFSFATNGKQALEIALTKQFDLILLDIMMPVLDGIATCKALKNDPLTKEIPIIFLTAKTDIDSISEAFNSGAVDYITKPFHPAELLSRVATHLSLSRANKILEQNNLDLNVKIRLNEDRLLKELSTSQQEIIFILTELIENTAGDHGKHNRVAKISKLLASFNTAINEEEESLIYAAAPLHDIGKITLPADIHLSNSFLTENQFKATQQHTTIANELLSSSKRKLLQAASVIAHQHHENYDGSGYPQQLKGEDIHIYARIVALADVLDALTHKRLYRDAWSFEDSISYIIDRSGIQFDPDLVTILKDNLDDFKELLDL